LTGKRIWNGHVNEGASVSSASDLRLVSTKAPVPKPTISHRQCAVRRAGQTRQCRALGLEVSGQATLRGPIRIDLVVNNQCFVIGRERCTALELGCLTRLFGIGIARQEETPTNDH
jgi:hypothetical protein